MENVMDALFFDVVQSHNGQHPLLIASFEDEDDAIEWVDTLYQREDMSCWTFEIRKRYKEQS